MTVKTASALALLLGSCFCAGGPALAEKSEPDVIFVPTPQAVVNEMLRLARLEENELLFDLGSGDGRIVITAAERYKARGIGYDIDPQRIAESEANAEAAGVTDRVKFIRGDLFEADLSGADAVTLYLLNRLNLALRPKLLRELKPGTPVVSHAFDMGDWEPDKTLEVGGNTVYYWVIPARADGDWQVLLEGPDGRRPLQLSLTQSFQKLHGSAELAGENFAVADGRLQGERLSLSLVSQRDGRRQEFNGRLQGELMVGELGDADGATYAWAGQRQAAARVAWPPAGSTAHEQPD